MKYAKWLPALQTLEDLHAKPKNFPGNVAS